MSHIAGKTGNVYGSALSIDTCETAWTTGGAGRAVSAVAGKVGTNCARVTTTTIGATALLQYKASLTVDLTTYDGILFWIRSSVTTTAGQLQLLLDESADCASPDETLDIPACTAATWRLCFSRMTDPSILNAVATVGLYQYANLDDGTFDVDDVNALKEIDGIKSWTLDYKADVKEVTDFDDAGSKSFIVIGSGWSGSFEGYKDGVPLGIGTEVYLVLGESTTAYNNWIGRVIITGASPDAPHDGIVTYKYTFQGTGLLQPPDA